MKASRLSKTLVTIVAAEAIAMGCESKPKVDYSMYEFKGFIDDEPVRFTYERNNIKLAVKKSDGRVIFYYDKKGEDGKIESMEVFKDLDRKVYTEDDGIGKPIVAEGQKDYDKYLAKIKEKKIQDGLENIK